MALDRLTERLRGLAAPQRGTLLPYYTAGLPDDAGTVALIRSADELGVAAVELGFPYSDSIADGPVIQDSFYQVLERGQRVAEVFALAAEVRPTVACGLIAMVSYSIVYRLGVRDFMTRAAEAGFDGVIVPDVPVEETQALTAATASANLCHIGLVAPTTQPARRAAIARASTGFVYQIAVAGTTGERAELPAELPAEVAALRRESGLPVCVGFGISTPAQVRAVCAAADGAIVGSALVRRVCAAAAEGLRGEELAARVQPFLAELWSGVNDPGQTPE